jgi:dTDP-4-amino-4,6-dideoxy-D-glucose acyltransferase
VSNDFASIGRDVRIDDLARFYGASFTSLGSSSRIDAFALISAAHPVRIGIHVHIAAGAKVFASGGSVDIDDFAGLSADVKIYTSSDDYTGGSLTNPTVPTEYRNQADGAVVVGRHTIIGAGSVILPGVTVGEGASVGALSLVREDVEAGVVVAGIPARPIGRRSIERLRELEARLRVAEAGESTCFE